MAHQRVSVTVIGLAIPCILVLAVGLAIVKRTSRSAYWTAREAYVSDARERTAPTGVTATITQGTVTVERRLPSMSFALEPGETLDPRLEPGPFQARFEVIFDAGGTTSAFIGAQIEGCRLTVEQGDRDILVDAAEPGPRLALTGDVVALDPGRNRLVYHVVVTGAGRVALRAMWKPLGAQVAEPLRAPGRHALEDEVLRGLVLMQDLRCVRCHDADGPELGIRLARGGGGPVLGDAGARLRPSWIRAYLADPHAVDAHALMPRIALNADAIENLTHFLVSMGGPLPLTAAPSDPALVDTGRVAYHRVGCFACHGPLAAPSEVPGAIATDTGPPRGAYTPVGDQAAKTTHDALASFLLDPVSVRPDGRMPAQALGNLEADAIAAYLMAQGASPPPAADASFTIDPARVRRGAQRFAAAGCAACHDLGADRTPIVSAMTAPRLADLVGRETHGCLAEGAARPARAPEYHLDVHQRRDLAAFIESLPERRSEQVPLDELAATTLRLNCHACHADHGVSGPEPAIAAFFATEGEADLGDEGRLPPRLDDAGARLTPSWVRDVLVGAIRARPYLAVRMPSYGEANVDRIPHVLGAAAGVTALLDREPAFSIDAANAGRTLVGEAALNCIQCHEIAGRASTGTPGPDLALMPGRLRYPGFERWLADPSRMTPGTRMPTFYVGGFGPHTDILGGRADDQIAAIWAYLSQGEALALPDGLVDPEGLELMVTDEPVVFRTFMKEAGVRAIACGFPEGVHCAFDADRCLVAMAWTGRFLSAAGAWAARGGSETNPDTVVWTAPAGPMLELPDTGTGPTTMRFIGYELDEARRPAFRYEARRGEAAVQVVERPAPGVVEGRRVLVRRIALRGAPGQRVQVKPGHGALRGGIGATVIELDDRGRASFELVVETEAR